MSESPSNNNRKLEQFDKAKFLSLETFRRNGQAVRTATFFAKFDDLLFISTTSNTGKVKRLRTNSRVRVAPSTFRGRLLGEWLEGKASPVEDSDLVNRVNRLLNKQHPFLRRVRALSELFSKAKRLVYSIQIIDKAKKIVSEMEH